MCLWRLNIRLGRGEGGREEGEGGERRGEEGGGGGGGERGGVEEEGGGLGERGGGGRRRGRGGGGGGGRGKKGSCYSREISSQHTSFPGEATRPSPARAVHTGTDLQTAIREGLRDPAPAGGAASTAVPFPVPQNGTESQYYQQFQQSQCRY